MEKIGYCYADDVKHDWGAFENGENLKDYDPDVKNGIKLQDDLQILYDREYLKGLVKGQDLYDYLCLNDMRFGCDSIGNAWFYESSLDKEEHKKYLKLMNTIGGKIIFPKHKKIGIQTINTIRGLNPKIKDRFDLTLECIKLYYFDKKNNPLYEILNLNFDFFNLFGKGEDGFKNYIEFFFLDECLVDNKGNIKFFIEEKFENPIPSNKKRDLYLKTIEFIENRNKKIEEKVFNTNK